jgi:uncharacterized protein YfaS (alpha-2-macroglobulin family)
VNVNVEGRYLYGAPASELALEGEVNVSARGRAMAGYAGYAFGLDDETFSPLRKPLENLPLTGADGTAKVLAELPALTQSTKPLTANVTIRMREPGGRVLTETTRLDVRPAKPFIGIKPEFEGGHAGDVAASAFEIIVLDRDGKPTAMKGVDWQLSRLETNFQWYNRDGRWDYETVTYTRKVANGTIDVDAGKPAHIEAATGYGHFRLEVTAQGSQALPASIRF